MPTSTQQNPKNLKQLSFYSIFSAKGSDLDAIYARLGNLGRAAQSSEMAGPMLDTTLRLTKPPVVLTPDERSEALRIAVHAMETKRSTQQFLESISLSPKLQNFAAAAYAGLLAAVMRDEQKTAMELLREAADIPNNVADEKVMADLPIILERFCSHIGMPPLSPEKRSAIASVFAVHDTAIVDRDHDDDDDDRRDNESDRVFNALQDLATEPELREFVSHMYAGFFARLTQIRMQQGHHDSQTLGDDAPEDNYLDRQWGAGFTAEAASSDGGVMELLERVNIALDLRDAVRAQSEDDDVAGSPQPRPGYGAPRG